MENTQVKRNYKIEELAQVLGLKVSSCRVAIAKGQLQIRVAYKEGRTIYYDGGDVERVILERSKSKNKLSKQPNILGVSEDVVKKEEPLKDCHEHMQSQALTVSKKSIPAEKIFNIEALSPDINFIGKCDGKIYAGKTKSDVLYGNGYILSDLFHIDMQGKVIVERPFNYYKCVGKVGIFDDGATSAKTIDILEEYNPSSTAPFRTQQGVYYKSFRLLNEEEIIKYCRG